MKYDDKIAYKMQGDLDKSLGAVLKATSFGLMKPADADVYVRHALSHKNSLLGDSFKDNKIAYNNLTQMIEDSDNPITALTNVKEQISPRRENGHRVRRGFFNTYVEDNPYLAPAFGFSIARKLEELGDSEGANLIRDNAESQVNKLLRNYHWGGSSILENSGISVLYASRAVNETQARSGVAVGFDPEVGLVATYHPDKFKDHIDQRGAWLEDRPETRKKIEQNLWGAMMFALGHFDTKSFSDDISGRFEFLR